MNELLKKAKSYQTLRTVRAVTYDELELMLSCLAGEISVRQYAAATGMIHAGQVTHRIATVLRWGVNSGNLKITLKKRT